MGLAGKPEGFISALRLNLLQSEHSHIHTILFLARSCRCGQLYTCMCIFVYTYMWQPHR